MVVMVLVLGPAGCGSGAEGTGTSANSNDGRHGLAPESWWKPRTWWNDEIIDEIKRRQERARAQLHKSMAAPLFVMACVAVVLAAFGTTWAERIRAWFAWRFSVHPLTQRKLATLGFLAFVAASLIYSMGRDLPSWTPLPIFILCGGASVIYFKRLRPLIGTDDLMRRKLAFAQLKTLLFLVLVVLVAVTMISGDGILIKPV